MAISLTHPFVSAIADGADTTLVQPSDWNDQHTLTLAASRLLGRATGSAGAAEEIPLGTGLSFSAGSLVFATAAIGTWIATPSSANLAAAVTDETGTGALVFANTPTLVTPILGTPTSGTLTNCTGLPISTGVSGLGTGVATFLATPSSANLATALTDETGSGTVLFSSAISDTAYAAAWNGDTTTAPSKNAVYDKFQASWEAPISTAWVVANPSEEVAAAAAAPGANVIWYTPVFIFRDVTISDLGIRLSATTNPSNIALAVYANNASTSQPTGSPLAATGNIAVTTANLYSGDITGANVTLAAGLYWFAFWTDGAANAAMRGYAGASRSAQFLGHTTLSSLNQAATDIGYGYNSAETYNASAWPDAASETLSLNAGARSSIHFFKVA